MKVFMMIAKVTIRFSMSAWLVLALFLPIALNAHDTAQALSFDEPKVEREAAEWLKEAKRIVFLGDSITYAGEVQVYLELWMQDQWGVRDKRVLNVGLPSETVSGLSEEGHAGGAFPRPVLNERLQRVLKVTQPDLVVACYGMNCGIYLPLSDERFRLYREGIEALHRQVSETAKCILVTPPIFDDQVAKKDFSYDAVLQHYGEWLIGQRKKGWCVLDLHQPMRAELGRRRMADPQFTLQPDAVHPNDEGYWVIAKCLLAELGEPRVQQWESAADFREALGLEEELVRLVRQRMQLCRDAYLSAAGHLRPGIAPGKPLEEAEALDRELSLKIHAMRN